MRLNIVKPFFPNISDIIDDFSEILGNGQVTNNSKYVNSFEDKLQSYLDCTLRPLTFCNGELALYSLIQAWKYKLGYSFNDSFNVIVPSFTFSGTVNAIITNNLTPVFCDIDNTLTLNISKIYEDIIKKYKIGMIIPVSVYGNLPKIEKILEISNKYNIISIFDNAPAFGSKYNGKFPSNYKINEIYSFHATKVFSTMEGGIAITHDKDIWDILVALRDFGQVEKKRGNVRFPGLNSKMQEICAIIGIKALSRYSELLNKRKTIIGKYNTFFNDHKFHKKIKTMELIVNVDCIYLYYPIILIKDNLIEFLSHMNSWNISVRRYYTAVHQLDYYRCSYNEMDLSKTNNIADKIVALPLYSTMQDEEISYLFDALDDFFDHKTV